MTKQDLKKYLLISLALHALLFLLAPKSKKTTVEKQSVEVTIEDGDKGKDFDKHHPPDRKLKDQDEDEIDPDSDVVKHAFHCDPSKPHYEGVGIVTTFNGEREQVVMEVARGYPADMAGIQPGDILLYYDQMDIAGPKGTTVTINIRRGDDVFSVVVTRDYICTGD